MGRAAKDEGALEAKNTAEILAGYWLRVRKLAGRIARIMRG
jgi:hypothetical protein